MLKKNNQLLFTPFKINKLQIANRIVRAATYEGLAEDESGMPSDNLLELYSRLAQNGVGMIITGFNFTSVHGRAMQTRQCGIDDDQKMLKWKKIIEEFKRRQQEDSCKIFMQISHAGRQTTHLLTGEQVLAPSSVKCTYFRERPRALSEKEILMIVEEYASAAKRVQEAGFDGVQVHCAHGYLIHQFFSTHTNRRRDKFGGSVENRFRFLDLILTRIREICGEDFALITKVSLGDDRTLTLEEVTQFVAMMIESKKVDAIEFSYGTMEYAMNIFRGDVPIDIVLKHNMLFKDLPALLKKFWTTFLYPLFFKNKLKGFSNNYNLASALALLENLSKQHQLKIPLILTGGVRSGNDIEDIIANKQITAVSISRPLICEEDFVLKVKNDSSYQSKCINCNLCAVMCDSGRPTRCYKQHK
ncbi:MAG: NADH:flavin oxidoreductase [Oligoflexia bacterium]|nr:NADH:flavin oxidoreductase [Oligoflexia bacterium]